MLSAGAVPSEALGRPARRTAGSARLVVVGTSHHVAPVAVRERLAAAGDDPAALEAAVRAQIGPAVVLATCNRLEVYCWTAQRGGAVAIARLLAKNTGVPVAALRPYLYTHTHTKGF